MSFPWTISVAFAAHKHAVWPVYTALWTIVSSFNEKFSEASQQSDDGCDSMDHQFKSYLSGN